MNIYYEKGKQIIKIILDNGYQAFFVGGFVRDYLLGKACSDIDITTDATPKQIQDLFPSTKATGLKYGTVTVYQDGHGYEITTFRTDGEYKDHRRPEDVRFSKSLEEDLRRRDFTINAFAMDSEEKIIDMFSGRKDLEERLIRAIGNPDRRFDEDALRILRAFRFVAKLGFTIEEKTYISIQRNIGLLKGIASERILSEFRKIFEGPHYRDALRYLFTAGMGEVFSELRDGLYHLANLPKFELGFLEFFAMCFYLRNQEIPDNWRFSNKDKAIMSKIMELVSVTEDDAYNEMLIYRLGKDIPLMANRVARVLNPVNDQEILIKKIHHDLPIKKTCDLKFKGQDILELTSERNAEVIGDIIDDITYQVITGQLPNEYEKLKEFSLNLLETKYGKR